MKVLKLLVREVIPVILGILIALALNNWNENRKEENYLQQIYASITNELEESKRNLNVSIPKQQILIDSISKYSDDDSISIFEILIKADGIQDPIIKTNAWKAVASSRIDLIEFEKLSALSEIDESKKNLELKTEKLVDFTIENLKSTSQEKKEVFLLLSKEILRTTKNVHLEIEEFLNEQP